MKTEKEKRTGFIRGLFLILTLGCCLLIFLNSAADSEVSGKQSGTITEALAPVVIPNYDQLSPGEQKTQKNELGSLVRKAGHCLEFMALGLWPDLPKKERSAGEAFSCLFVRLGIQRSVRCFR